MSTLFAFLYALEAILSTESYRILWKVLWLGVVIFAFRKRIKWWRSDNILLIVMIVRSLEFFINKGALSGDILEIKLGVKYLLMPLCFIAIPLISLKDWQRSILLLLGLQLFWVFGVADSGLNQFDLGQLGKSFTGSFGVPHLASISIACIFVYLLYSKVRYKSFLLAVTVFLVLWTWVRTGLLIIVVSLIFRNRKKVFRSRTILLTIIVSVSCFGGYLSLPSDIQLSIYNRLFDINYSGEQIVGSGRMIFFKNSLEVWSNEDLHGLIFGGGIQPLADKNFADTGYSVYAHNEYLTMLAQNGVVGFATSIVLTLALFRTAARQNNEFFLAVIWCWTAMNLVQGGIWFMPEVLIALAHAEHPRSLQTP